MDGGAREWNHNVEEPELEFDDMGMELAAQDGESRESRIM